MAKFLVIEQGKSGTITEDLDLFVIDIEENAEVTFNGKIKCFKINCHPGSVIYFKSTVLYSNIHLNHNVIAIFGSETVVSELKSIDLVAIDVHTSLTCFKEELSSNTHIFLITQNVM